MRLLGHSVIWGVLLNAITPLYASFLHRDGNRLLDSRGNEARLTGINWFGFETSNLAPHGLWSRDWKGMLMQIKALGFNSLRIPYCDKLLEPGAKPSSIGNFGTDPFRGINNGPINTELTNKTSIEVLDIIIEGCKQLGLKVILDNHSRVPDAFANELVWYTPAFSEDKWIANWVTLAKRYQGNNTVVGMDLDNEPHGKISDGGSQWGTGDMAKDWRLAAQKCGNAILAVNPDVLILIEGVEQVGTQFSWWGGNLQGAKDFPVVLTKPEKLIYSPHEYGPEVFLQTWFSEPNFPANMPAIWDKNFGYLHKSGASHLLVGEFGIKDRAAFGGKAEIWFDAFMKYLGTSYSWTFWCFNPNSGDTGGILQNDWVSVEQWKIDKLKPYLAPLVGSVGTGIGVKSKRILEKKISKISRAHKQSDIKGRILTLRER